MIGRCISNIYVHIEDDIEEFFKLYFHIDG